MKGNNVSSDAILRLYNNHTVTSLRKPDEIQKFLRIPNTHLYTAWDSNNRLVAYAVEGKGADLKGYIHEWGGNVTGFLTLLRHMQISEKRDFTLILPAHSQNLNHRVQELGYRPITGYLGMIKILNHATLFDKINRYAKAIGLKDFVLSQEGTEFLIGHKDEPTRIKSEKEMVQVLFGPHSHHLVGKFNASSYELLKYIAPIPMWIWGWDSV